MQCEKVDCLDGKEETFSYNKRVCSSSCGSKVKRIATWGREVFVGRFPLWSEIRKLSNGKRAGNCGRFPELPNHGLRTWYGMVAGPKCFKTDPVTASGIRAKVYGFESGYKAMTASCLA
jgi:hypothetical protein